MTLSVEVQPDVENSLKRIALRDGVSLEELVQRLLAQQLPKDRSTLSNTALLERINQTDTRVLRAQIKSLWNQREQSELTPVEEARLAELQEALNTLNAERWEDIAELAQRQSKSLSTLIQELGLSSVEIH